MMTGTPSTSKHTLCLSLVPMRVPLPPARIIVTNGLFIIPRTPAPARSLRHRRGISKARSALRAGSQGRREEICGKTQFHLNSDPTSDVKTRHRLGGANVVTGESPRGNKGRIRGEHQENTKRIRREYEGNTKTTREPHPSNRLATGLYMAWRWLSVTVCHALRSAETPLRHGSGSALSPPKIVPLVAQLLTQVLVECQLPRDVADAVEVVPPVRPSIPIPPVRIIPAGEVVAVLKHVHLLNLAVRLGAIGSAQHIAGDFQLGRSCAVAGDGDLAGQVDARIAIAILLHGIRRALALDLTLLDLEIHRGGDWQIHARPRRSVGHHALRQPPALPDDQRRRGRQGILATVRQPDLVLHLWGV